MAGGSRSGDLVCHSILDKYRVSQFGSAAWVRGARTKVYVKNEVSVHCGCRAAIRKRERKENLLHALTGKQERGTKNKGVEQLFKKVIYYRDIFPNNYTHYKILLFLFSTIFCLNVAVGLTQHKQILTVIYL